MKNIISWFEIPVLNMERAKEFYETIFSFKIRVESMGEAIMGFFPCKCDCKDVCECVGGALVELDGEKPSGDGTNVYFDCGQDLQPVLARVERAGGKIVIPKSLIAEEIGYYANIIDSEGNRIALHSKK